MSTTPTSQADLAKLFSAVTRKLQENQSTLNSADEYNHNHGDNMVETFQTITKAVREKKASPPSEQLAYASQQLNQKAQSGSAKLYSEGLEHASARFQGQKGINADNALQLVQTLMGGQPTGGQAQAPSAGSGMTDLLGSLLGGQSPTVQPSSSGQASDGMSDLLGSLLGGQSPTAQPSSSGQSSDGMADMLGSLLGGQSSASQSQGAQQTGGIDMNMLLNAGMTFFQARQQGAEPVQAIVQALMSGSQMNNTSHREQSGQLVASTLINVIGSMLGGKKR